MKYKGRTIAVDLAVDKTRFETQKNTMLQGTKKKEEHKNDKIFEQKEDDDDMNDNEDEDDDDEEIESEDEEIEEENDEADKEEEQEEEEEEEDQKEDFSQTIFIRNISFDIGQSEFRDFFKKFGPIEYAKVYKINFSERSKTKKLVIDRETETHNGNGFVKFKDAKTAKYLVEQSKKQEAINPFHKDGTAVTGRNISYELFISNFVKEVSLELGGRRMIILQAMGRKDVSKVRLERQKKDDENAPKNKNSLEYWIYQDRNKKRSLYLAEVGLNNPDQVHKEDDKAKFEANLEEKVEKAKNPNYFVSHTRNSNYCFLETIFE